ncbi:MAG: ferritin family protein [Candidatus Ancaeobacter aquaticus]|nr:ferritin family protein [Candidatus Ancaeobacter aquaticus]
MVGRKYVLSAAVLIAILVGLSFQNVMGAGLSKIPIDLKKVSEEDRDKEILRVGIIAEYDAINLYEQMAAYAKNPMIKKVLLDVAREEKIHIGEFQALLMSIDKEQLEEMQKGEKEIEEMMEKK